MCGFQVVIVFIRSSNVGYVHYPLRIVFTKTIARCLNKVGVYIGICGHPAMYGWVIVHSVLLPVYVMGMTPIVGSFGLWFYGFMVYEGLESLSDGS